MHPAAEAIKIYDSDKRIHVQSQRHMYSGAKLSDDVFWCYFGDVLFVFVRLLGLRGRAGEREGRREGGGGFFPGKH